MVFRRFVADGTIDTTSHPREAQNGSVCNAPSPAVTSSIPIADHAVRQEADKIWLALIRAVSNAHEQLLLRAMTPLAACFCACSRDLRGPLDARDACWGAESLCQAPVAKPVCGTSRPLRVALDDVARCQHVGTPMRATIASLFTLDSGTDITRT
jgi:hypothetical protein